MQQTDTDNLYGRQASTDERTDEQQGTCSKGSDKSCPTPPTSADEEASKDRIEPKRATQSQFAEDEIDDPKIEKIIVDLGPKILNA